MKMHCFLWLLLLSGFYSFKPLEKTTEPLLGIWVNPGNDVKIKIEDVKGQTRAILYWTSKSEVKEHIGRVVIKEIEPYGNSFKALVMAPAKRKFVSGIIEFKSADTVVITGYDEGKSVSKVYTKVKN